jgi:hypothetical protein
MGLPEIQATWDMLVQFKNAIRRNQHWAGDEVSAVAMGLQWVVNMESQYRGLLERSREQAKNETKTGR